jgi:uncharacterized membrane-anchored protein YhcB (DUF1043 family)
MEIIPLKIQVNRPLVQSDEIFMQIQELIDTKRQFLIDKQKKLKHITKQNEFLDNVKQDYVNYYNYISQQKQDQIKALELLNGYIDDLTASGKLSEYNIEDAKFEQNKILREVKSIKNGFEFQTYIYICIYTYIRA